MSHFTTIKCELKSREDLIQALKSLFGEVHMNAEVQGYGSQMSRAEFSIKTQPNKMRCDLGFVKNEKGSYDVVCDPFIARNSATIINNIKNAYNKNIVSNYLRTKGYTMASQKELNGEIQLVWRKAI